jgi:hypothetical protein
MKTMLRFTAALVLSATISPALPMTNTAITSNATGLYAVNDNGHVAYREVVGGDFQVFLFKDGASTQITNNASIGGAGGNSFIDYLAINNSDQIVWTQYDYSATPLQVHLFLYSNGAIKKIDTLMGASSNYCITPQINNNGAVVWEQYNTDGGINSGAEIFLYDGAPVRLTSDANKDQDPRINDNGNVVWTGDRRALDDWDTRVFLYDAGGTSVAAYSAGSSSYAPQIDQDNSIVFIRLVSGAASLIRTKNGQEKVIDTGTGFNVNYGFVANNGRVAYNNKNNKIILFNGADTQTISTSATPNRYPSLNALGHVAWVEADAGDIGGRVMFYNGVSDTPVCSYTACSAPIINGADEIVWQDNSTLYITRTGATSVVFNSKIPVRTKTGPAKVLVMSGAHVPSGDLFDLRGRRIFSGRNPVHLGVLVRR